MSKFRVGQRVRVVRSLHGRAAGVEAVIIAPADTTRHDWLIRIDGNHSFRTDGLWLVYNYQLEPATDCYDKTEWDACVWKPEHLRVGA